MIKMKVTFIYVHSTTFGKEMLTYFAVEKVMYIAQACKLVSKLMKIWK